MNLSVMLVQLGEYLDDPSASRHNVTAKTRFLNSGQVDVKRYIEEANELFFQKTTTVSVASGDTDSVHDLPSDFGKLVSVENTDTSVPTQASPTNFQDRHDHIGVDKRTLPQGMTFTGGYYLKHAFGALPADGGKFQIGFTSPDSSYTASILYTANLADLATGTDVSRVPADYHDLICLFAAMRGYAIEQMKFPDGLEVLRQEQLMQLRNYVETFGRQAPLFVNVQN